MQTVVSRTLDRTSRPLVCSPSIAALSPRSGLREPYYRDLLDRNRVAQPEMSGVRSIRVAFGMGANATSSALLFRKVRPTFSIPRPLRTTTRFWTRCWVRALGSWVHPVDTDERTWTDPNYSSKLVAFWRALGRHLSTRNPETLFIKVGYDPTSSDPDAWYAVQKLLLSAVRESNPTRTLLVTPNAYTRLGDRDPVKALASR